MKQWIASCFTGLLMQFISTGLPAQLNSSAFYTVMYKASEGLPDSYVLSIFQDRSHYLWVGTFSGLSRFDGKSFQNYGINNGFIDLFICAIGQDDRDRIWVGTRKGIGFIRNGRFIPCPVEDKMEIAFVFNFTHINDRFWAFTDKGLYELQGDQWKKKKLAPGWENKACRYAIEYDGAIYACYADAILRVEADGRYRTVLTAPDRNNPFVHFRKFNDRLFVSMPAGLFEIRDKKLIPLFASQLKGRNIYVYMVDHLNRFWVSTEEEGLLVTDPFDEKRLKYKVPLSINLVSGIYEDTDRNIWIANYQGLVKVKSSFFDDLTLFRNEMKNQYYSFATDREGQMFFYLYHKGLFYQAVEGFRQRRFSLADNVFEKKVSSELIDMVQMDGNHHYWAVSRARQLLKVDAQGREEKIYPSGREDTSSNVYHITWNAADRTIYICGRRLFTDDGSSIKEFRDKRTGEPIYNTLRALALRNGNLLVNSRSSGLWLVKRSGEAFALSEKAGLKPDNRMLMAEDHAGKIWLSLTGMGLRRYALINDSTFSLETSVTTANDLPNDIVEAIAVDGKNRLWAATLSGLLVMDTMAGTSAKKFVMFNIGREQGLDFVVSNGISKLMADAKGNIWFCANNLLMRFRVNDLDMLSPPPLTYIEAVKLNMKETDWHQWSDSLEGYFMLPKKLRLPYNQNTLTFIFKGINYNSDEKLWYSYKLVGVDTAWGLATETNIISFIKLTPGHFTFLVRVRNNNSGWSEPVEFPFTILPPFWQTWWFRSMVILLASLVLAFIFRTQLKRINKKAAVQNQLRNLEMKALKAQMNPHFVYNALNSIQSLVIDDKKEDALNYMVKFSRLLRQVLNHSELNVVKLDKELDTLRLYIQLESLRLNFSLNYSISVDENILPEKESVPPLILQPFVENALWHGLGNKQGEKKLSISINADDHWLYCRIVDNGVGRSYRAIGSNNSVSYSEGPRGTEITTNRLIAYNDDPAAEPVQISDLLNTDGTPAGTSVTLRIRRY